MDVYLKKQEESTWPNYEEDCIEPPEAKTRSILLTNVHQDWEIYARYSSLSKLKRVTVYTIRFLSNSKNPKQRHYEDLTEAELDQCFSVLISTA